MEMNYNIIVGITEFHDASDRQVIQTSVSITIRYFFPNFISKLKRQSLFFPPSQIYWVILVTGGHVGKVDSLELPPDTQELP